VIGDKFFINIDYYYKIAYCLKSEISNLKSEIQTIFTNTYQPPFLHQQFLGYICSSLKQMHKG
jgi:hypothetical protein